MHPSTGKRVIITGDDFGLHVSVNEAIERACTEGVLTAASLMVGQPASADAVRRARRLPGLKVGLHVALTDARPVLPPAWIPDLVDAQGRFRAGMAHQGARFFFLPRVRRQLAAEIRAQFQAFADTGLILDHVNAHKHFHLHPTVLGLILSIGRGFGLKAVRLPREPLLAGLRANRRQLLARLAWAGFLFPWTRLMQARLDRAGVAYSNAVFGLSASGRMGESLLLSILAELPAGVSEIYFHPATRSGIEGLGRGYDHDGELAALISPRVRTAIEQQAIKRIAFVDLVSS